MTTVPQSPDDKVPDRNVTLTLQSNSTELYGRSAAGTNRVNDSSSGPSATDGDASAGSVPTTDAYKPDLRGNQLAENPPPYSPPNRSGESSPQSGGTVK